MAFHGRLMVNRIHFDDSFEGQCLLCKLLEMEVLFRDLTGFWQWRSAPGEPGYRSDCRDGPDWGAHPFSVLSGR